MSKSSIPTASLDEKANATDPSQTCKFPGCTDSSIFEHCDVCHDRPCMLESGDRFQDKGPFHCIRRPDPLFEDQDLLNLRASSTLTALNTQRYFIPGITKRDTVKLIGSDIVVSSIRQLWSKSGTHFITKNLKEYLELKEGTKLILSFNVPDPILEKIWTLYQRNEFDPIFAGLDADYLISPNFSNYFGLPTYHCLRNIWRSVEICNRFTRLGYQVLLDVCSPNPETHAFYIDLITQSGIKMISVNCQTTKGKKYMVPEFRRFAALSALPKDVSFLIHGMYGEKQAKAVYEILKGRRIYFTAQTPYFKAICKESLTTHNKVEDREENLIPLYAQYYETMHKALADAAENAFKNSGGV